MSITYRNIYDKTMFFLKKEGKFFTSSDIKQTITVDSFKRIAEELGYPKETYQVILTSGSWVVSAPTNFIRIDKNSDMTYYNGVNVTKIEPAIQSDIGRDEILSAEPDTPSQYFMETENKIGLYPPATSGLVVIPYVKSPTVMSADTDTNELSERCYMAAVYWTVSECMLTDSDERYVGYRQLYDKEIDRLKDQYRIIMEIPKDVKPHRRYLK